MTVPSTATADELEALAATIRAFCAERLPEPTKARPGVIRDAAGARKHWAQLSAEIGIGALLIPEAYDGLGAGLVEAGRVAEALSAELAAVPFLSAGVLAPTLLAGLAGPAGDLLTRIAQGELVAAVAWADSDPGEATADLKVEGTTEEACTVTGNFGYVIDADLADVVLLVGTGGEQVAAVAAADLRITPRPTFDLTRGLSDVVAEGAPATLLGSGAPARAAFERMLAAGRLVLAAEAAGGAHAALRQAVRYSRDRIQFGREIGSFQAIKHILADCYVAAESATSVARSAIAADAAGAADAAELCWLASFYCAEKFAAVAAADIQVHGGIGFTAECSAHLFRRRAESDRHLLGSPSRFREAYLDALISKEALA